jgi:hypothetical protein
MRLRTKAILINVAIALTLGVESRFYPGLAVVVAAAILLPVANLALLLKARKKES